VVGHPVPLALSATVPRFNGPVYSDTCAIESQRAQMECSPGLEMTRACGMARATRDAVCGGRIACGVMTEEHTFVLRLDGPLRGGYELMFKTVQPCTGVHSQGTYMDYGKDLSVRMREGWWMTFELTTSSGRALETSTIDPFTGTCVSGSCGLSSVQRYVNVGRAARESNVFIVAVHTR